MDCDVMQPATYPHDVVTSPIIKNKLNKYAESLPELVGQLRSIFEDDVINVEYVTDIMSKFKCNPKEYRKYAKFDPHRYTRNLVDSGNGKYNLMLLCWNEGQGSSIHSHANSHCFLKNMEGTVQEELYEWPEDDEDGEMQPKRITQYPKGAVQYMNDSLGLHRIENPSHSDTLITLHLYSPPFDECATFDKRTGKSHDCHVTFWSKYGKRTPWSKVEQGMMEHTLPKD